MADQDRQSQPEDVNSIDDMEIEPLSDEALEEVAGGSSNGCCSCDTCSSGEQLPSYGTAPSQGTTI